MYLNCIFAKKLFLMLYKFLLFVFLTSVSLQAQYSVSGKIDSNGKYTWTLLYEIQNGKPVYVENANVKDGEFTFNFTKDQPAGIYRIYYQMEDRLYVDFIYNKENIKFSFKPEDPTNTIAFSESDENKIYQKYYTSISKEQKKLDSLQVAFFRTKDAGTLKDLKKKYIKQRSVVIQKQKYFEKKSQGKLAHHFIAASARYNPKVPEKDPRSYLLGVKEHFFDNVDFNDTVLSNSTFINDKFLDFVLYLNQANNPDDTNTLQKKAIENITTRISGNYSLLKTFEESLLKQYVNDGNLEMVNFVLKDHYENLPLDVQDYAFKHKVVTQIKTAVGSKAPNIEWVEKGETKNLYDLYGNDFYVVVFFSSSCPHCQREMPLLYDFIKNIQNVKVIAVGLEDQRDGWEKMTANWKNYINILDLDKWESFRAKNYGITEIPTFFVLDKHKVILAKPDNVKELKKIFIPTE